MSRTVRVTVVGDYNAENRTHTATTNALRHAARGIGVALDLQWAHTSRIKPEKPGEELDKVEGIFLAPGSPYASIEAALATVRYAREQGRPFAAT
jgi:CTP synthase (UTP-ammonia lyase)